MDGTASRIYGTAPVFVGAVPADTALSATDATRRGLGAFVDPHNPVLWLLGIVLVTVGAAGIAGSVKLGPAAIGGKIGKA
jgi:hypothetical protein